MGTTQTQKVVIHNHIGSNVGSKPKRKTKGKGRRRGKSGGVTYDGAVDLITPATNQMLQAHHGFNSGLLLNDINGSLFQQRALGASPGGFMLPTIPDTSVKMLGEKIDDAQAKNQAAFTQGYRQLKALTEKQHDLEQRLHDVNATRNDVGNLHDFDDFSVSSDAAAPSTLVAAASPFKFQGSVSSGVSSHTQPASPSRSAIIDREAEAEAPAAPTKEEMPKEAKIGKGKPPYRQEPVPRKNKKTVEWGFGGRKPTKPKVIARRAEILLGVLNKL